jgi:hypothetical protein
VFFPGNVKMTSQRQNSQGKFDGNRNIEDVTYLWWLVTRKRREAAVQSQTVA